MGASWAARQALVPTYSKRCVEKRQSDAEWFLFRSIANDGEAARQSAAPEAVVKDVLPSTHISPTSARVARRVKRSVYELLVAMS